MISTCQSSMFRLFVYLLLFLQLTLTQNPIFGQPIVGFDFGTCKIPPVNCNLQCRSGFQKGIDGMCICMCQRNVCQVQLKLIFNWLRKIIISYYLLSYLILFFLESNANFFSSIYFSYSHLYRKFIRQKKEIINRFIDSMLIDQI